MMKVAACAVLAAVCAVFLKKNNAELSLCLSLVSCIAIAAVLLTQISGIKDYIFRLAAKASIEETVLKPLFRVCLIAAVTRLCGSFCIDAGERTAAELLDLCGAAASVIAMYPMLDLLLSTIGRLIGV